MVATSTKNKVPLIFKLKNGGSCTDNGGKMPFLCNCLDDLPFFGPTCDTYDICNGWCMNGGNCTVNDTDTNNIKPKCDCPKDEFGNELYYGETCNISAVCYGDPCQNGGECEARFDNDSSEDCIAI